VTLTLLPGAIIVSAIFLKGWKPSQCTQAFERLANVAFRKSLFPRIPIISKLRAVISVLLRDSIYKAINLERVLKDIYGNGTKMGDFSYATLTGTKVGLPVATISEPHTVLVTNYHQTDENAVGKGKQFKSVA